jgi:hypothetical protein
VRGLVSLVLVAQVLRMLPVVHAYLERLTEAVETRQALAARLALKADGKPYGVFAYRRDRRACDRAKSAYSELGEDLNNFIRTR